MGVSDPYGIISLSVDKTQLRFISRCIKNRLNLIWNYLCQMPVDNIDNVSDIEIGLFDKDSLTKDDPLGSCTISRLVVICLLYTSDAADE